jgi:hypothetical protein
MEKSLTKEELKRQEKAIITELLGVVVIVVGFLTMITIYVLINL